LPGQVLDYNSIIAEVTRQLSSRFVPNPAVIKKRCVLLLATLTLEKP
jgi:cullin 3